MKMKRKKTCYHCQRKQNLSHNSNCLISTCWINWFFPPPPTKPTTQQWSLVNDWLVSASHTWLLLFKCQFNGAGGGDVLHLGEGLSLWALQFGPHVALFSGKEMETKSQQGRDFVSGTLDWLVSCYNQNMLSRTTFEAQKNWLSAISLHSLWMPAVSLIKETCLSKSYILNI